MNVGQTDGLFEYPQENFSGDKPYRVLKVVDGDTIKFEYKGRSETVRLEASIPPKPEKTHKLRL